MPFLVQMPRPRVAPARPITLSAIHAGATDNVWIVGWWGDPFDLAVARRWDGAAWVTHDTTLPFTSPFPFTVWADATGHALTNAADYDAPTQYWDGSAWVSQTIRAAYFVGAPGAVTAVRQFVPIPFGDLTQQIGWYTGAPGSWSALSTDEVQPTPPHIYTHAYLGRADAQIGGEPLLAVQQAGGLVYGLLGGGDDQFGTPHQVGTIVQLDGAAVNEVYVHYDTGGSPVFLWTSFCATADGYLFALRYRSDTDQSELLASTDGTTWTSAATFSGYVSAQHGVAQDDWWVFYDTPAAEHWDGSGYTLVALPTPDVTFAACTVVSAWAYASGDVWAIGNYQPTGGAQQGIVWHWAGSAWAIHTRITP